MQIIFFIVVSACVRKIQLKFLIKLSQYRALGCLDNG